MAVLVHFDQALLTQLFHGDADAGLGEIHLIHNIDGSDDVVPPLQDQNGLEVIFGRFM
jgi:hypothetical protein